MYNELIARNINYNIIRDDIEIPFSIRTALYIEGDILFNLEDINVVSCNSLDPYIIPDYVYCLDNRLFIVNSTNSNMNGQYITYEGLIVALNGYDLDNNEGLYDLENWVRCKAVPTILKGFIAPVIEAIKGSYYVTDNKIEKKTKKEVPLPFRIKL